MPVEIASGYPCRRCNSWDIEVRKEWTYHWVNFGELLVEGITNFKAHLNASNRAQRRNIRLKRSQKKIDIYYL